METISIVHIPSLKSDFVRVGTLIQVASWHQEVFSVPDLLDLFGHISTVNLVAHHFLTIEIDVQATWSGLGQLEGAGHLALEGVCLRQEHFKPVLDFSMEELLTVDGRFLGKEFFVPVEVETRVFEPLVACEFSETIVVFEEFLEFLFLLRFLVLEGGDFGLHSLDLFLDRLVRGSKLLH